MSEPRFGVSLAPLSDDLAKITDLAVAADESGLELLGVQDHPYVADFVDTMSLIGHFLARTENIHVFPDVANLPLRPPAMLGKEAASLDLLSGGRFELGLGAGANYAAVRAMGGPSRTPGQALDALEEGIDVLRATWQSGRTVRAGGEHYQVNGLHSGPAPAHHIGIWLGSVGPRSLRLTGRKANGWAAPIPSYLPYEKRPQALAEIDAGAREAGRDPAEIRRIAQLVGTVTEQRTDHSTTHDDLKGSAPIRASAEQWVQLIGSLNDGVGFDTFVFWPEETTLTQLARWAGDVVPGVRDRSS